MGVPGVCWRNVRMALCPSAALSSTNRPSGRMEISLRRASSVEGSTYNFEYADTTLARRYFEEAFEQSKKLLEVGLLYPAYEQLLKTSHAFNLLDARGAVSANERPSLIKGVQALAKRCAQVYLKRTEGQGAGDGGQGAGDRGQGK